MISLIVQKHKTLKWRMFAHLAIRLKSLITIILPYFRVIDDTGKEILCWSNWQQGYVKAAFYYGYPLTQLVGGYLAQLFGTRYVFGLQNALAAILTILTPFASMANVWMVIALRFVMGLVEGVTYPSLPPMIGKLFLTASMYNEITLPLIAFDSKLVTYFSCCCCLATVCWCSIAFFKDPLRLWLLTNLSKKGAKKSVKMFFFSKIFRCTH